MDGEWGFWHKSSARAFSCTPPAQGAQIPKFTSAEVFYVLSDEEHVAATSGKGFDIAQNRIAIAGGRGEPLTRVAHLLDAIEALSLHLAYVETSAEIFRRHTQARNLPRLPKASPDDLALPWPT